MRTIMTKVIKATVRQDGPSLKGFWKNYNIWGTINNIEEWWAEIKESTMKPSWKQLCPGIMSDFINFEKQPETHRSNSYRNEGTKDGRQPRLSNNPIKDKGFCVQLIEALVFKCYVYVRLKKYCTLKNI